MPTLLYLHGFASSPGAAKARALGSALEPTASIVVPDLNLPSFAELSFERMVERAIEVAAASKPDVVLGSSLGALVALAAASRASIVAPLLLVAPALGFARRWASQLPPGEGPVPFHHFAEGREIPVHRAFFEEMAAIRADEAPSQRVVVVMGRRDETVPCEIVREAWNGWVESGRLALGSRYEEIADGDHGLVAHVEHIARVARELLGI
jgi:predicted esterase YcpF (UPF0227 family)